MSLKASILTFCLLAAAAFAGRILFLLAFRQPRLARVLHHGYSAGEQARDFDFHQIAPFDGVPTAEDFHLRADDAFVAYEVDGREVRADVTVTTHLGHSPESAQIVWIDPRRPERATTRGPGYWSAWLLLSLFVALPAWWWLPAA